MESNAKSKHPFVVPSEACTNSFTLQRRLSTATDVKYNMYLMNLETMLKLFGTSSDSKENIQLCHQSLLEQERLTRFEDLPLGSFVIFVSHQWSSFAHPDPNGRQLEVLCKTMRDLRDGAHTNVSTDPYHVLLYNTKTTTHKSEWRTLLSNAYVWYVMPILLHVGIWSTCCDSILTHPYCTLKMTGTIFGASRSQVWKRTR